MYRSATYSPGRHRSNDAAIMDATTAILLDRGWSVERLGEGDVEAGIVPTADLYLNMCQGAGASSRLLELEASGARMINAPSSVLGCHRHRLVPALAASGLRFPATVIARTADASRAALRLPAGDLWIKRGDVHAQEAADVVRSSRDQVASALDGFAARGIRQVALQTHIDGPVLKFYGVGNGSLFHAFREDGRPVDGDTVDLRALRQLAFAAAKRIGLQVFGGDAVVASRTAPMLVDLNDWPSFAPIRDQAAAAIARLAAAGILQRSL
ncbi:MAG: hypothetical protein ACREK8_04025 [Gemmatimonadales bacterium]